MPGLAIFRGLFLFDDGQPTSKINGLEKKLGRTVSIESRPTSENLSKCNLQEQSHLFRLPAELRNYIFELATAPYVSVSHYGQYTCESVTTHKYHVKSGQGLLLTCRRIWLETNSLLMSRVEHTFQFYTPANVSGPDEELRLKRFLERLTPNNRQDLEVINIIASTYWLQYRLERVMHLLMGSTGACPKILAIKIFGRCEATQSWLASLLNSSSLARLDEIRLEFETPDNERPRPIALGLQINESKFISRSIEGIETNACQTELPAAKRFVLDISPPVINRSKESMTFNKCAYCGKHGWQCERIYERSRTTFVWRARSVKAGAATNIPSSWMLETKKTEKRKAAVRRVQRRWEGEGEESLLMVV